MSVGPRRRVFAEIAGPLPPVFASPLLTVRKPLQLGKSDEDVFGYAWRMRQFLLSSDKDFLDDRRFPPHRNPGVIILPNAPIDSDSFITALREALYTIAPLGRAYRGSKIIITAEGEISITSRSNKTGAMEKMRFRFDRQGNTFLWEDEPA